jgi:hypothetical protein
MVLRIHSSPTLLASHNMHDRPPTPQALVSHKPAAVNSRSVTDTCSNSTIAEDLGCRHHRHPCCPSPPTSAATCAGPAPHPLSSVPAAPGAAWPAAPQTAPPSGRGSCTRLHHTTGQHRSQPQVQAHYVNGLLAAAPCLHELHRQPQGAVPAADGAASELARLVLNSPQQATLLHMVACISCKP